MLNLKSVYFYFLATKINLLNILKLVYFKTSFYSKSLRSITPKKFYFFPNSFLLSSLVGHKNFLFNISNIDTNIFWKKKVIKKEEIKLHEFLWLNLIDRKNDNTIIKKIINIWIYKNSKYKSLIWDSSTISKRIISWILNAEIILNNTEFLFRNDFLNSIIMQTNHLKKNYKHEHNYSKKLEMLCAILLTGLVFKEYSENYNFAIKDLEKLTENFFDKDGFPLNRNPNDLLIFLKFLIIIRECINDGQEYIPEFLDKIIDNSLCCLKSIITPKRQLPLFNGAVEVNVEDFIDYIESLNYKIKKTKINVGKLQILSHKKSYIFFDVGAPPNKKFTSNYQSGPLSFEYYSDNEKIITNCGFGLNISKKATLISRLTSAQSTLTINDTSINVFEKNRFLNLAFGNSIKNSFKINNFQFNDDLKKVFASASHDAYLKRFGCIHKREIKINKIDNSIVGLDELNNENKSNNLNFNIRFHLYPGISAIKTMGGNTVLINIKKNKSLVFRSENYNLTVEKSIFLGRNQILNNFCILISGVANDKNIKINWELKKSI